MSKYEPRHQEVKDALAPLSIHPTWNKRGDKLYLMLRHRFSQMPQYEQVRDVVLKFYPYAHVTSWSSMGSGTFRID